MALLVVLLGVLIAAFGLAGLAAPERTIGGMLRWQPRSRYYFAVAFRLVFGAILLSASSSCRFPTVIVALGAIAMIAALILAPLGSGRVDSMFQWWLRRPILALRAWFTAAISFGVFLIYAGI